MGTFNERSRADIKTDIAYRLDDVSKNFWSDAELGIYLNEAIRVFQCMTGYWRVRTTVSTINNQAFYQQFTATVTDAAVMTEMLYQMIEPPVIPYAGSDMFQADDFPRTLQRRRAQFLAETGLYLQHDLINNSEITTDSVQLAQDTFDVRRIAWIAGGSVYTNLWRAGQYSLNNLRLNNIPPTVPEAYAWDLRAPRLIEIAPSITVGGSDIVEIIGAFAFDNLDPTNPTALQIPDDWYWAVKYGAEADLLKSDGQARDPKRAAYCESRYQQGVQLAKSYRKVFRVNMQGSRFEPVRFNDIDSRRVGWQNMPGQPDVAAFEGGLLAFCPMPDGVYSIETDQLDNAPVMTDDAQFIQIDQANYEAIIGYAVHIAMFKIGGAEFDATMPLYQNFSQLAGESTAREMAA